jgi:hypothetical protein
MCDMRMTFRKLCVQALCDAAEAEKGRNKMLDSEVASLAKRLHMAEQAKEQTAEAMKVSPH